MVEVSIGSSSNSSTSNFGEDAFSIQNPLNLCVFVTGHTDTPKNITEGVNEQPQATCKMIHGDWKCQNTASCTIPACRWDSPPLILI